MDFKQKFEPKGDKVIHGAGQSPEQFNEYWKAVGKSKPSIYMLYVRVNEIREKLPKKIESMFKISKDLIPQIGLNFIPKGKGPVCKEVSAGEYDSELLFMIKSLEKIENPVFLRIGYEFDKADKYNPKHFVSAWKHIVNLIKKNNVENIATVWCACPYHGTSPVKRYYPGDRYVDWFGIDVFNSRYFKDDTYTPVADFLTLAKKHKKPVMIGESTPARVGVDGGEKSWNEWFKPYFKWIHSHKIIKAFCYINWDWAKDWKQPEWGNGRIQENKYVNKKLVDELKDKRYIHNQPVNKFLKLVHHV